MSGGNWNLVISQAGAAVILPPKAEAIGQQALVGYPFHYSPDKALMARGAPNMLGFASKEPLFIAESMPISVSFPKGVISEPTFSQKINWWVADYGDIWFPALGWVVILAAYLASWKYIQKTTKKQPIKLIKTPQMLRYLLTAKFDKISFGAFLLDLFKKNIIDIQKNGDSILLIKRTDNLRTLPKKEQKAVRTLFGNDSVMAIKKENLPRIRQALHWAEEETATKFRIFCFKLNFGYLFFSAMMLLLSQLFVAALAPNSAAIFSGMVFADLVWHGLEKTNRKMVGASIVSGALRGKFCYSERVVLNVGGYLLYGSSGNHYGLYQALYQAQWLAQSQHCRSGKLSAISKK